MKKPKKFRAVGWAVEYANGRLSASFAMKKQAEQWKGYDQHRDKNDKVVRVYIEDTRGKR